MTTDVPSRDVADDLIDDVIRALRDLRIANGATFDYRAVYDFLKPESPEVPSLAVLVGVETPSEFTSGVESDEYAYRDLPIFVEALVTASNLEAIGPREAASGAVSDIRSAVLADPTRGGMAITRPSATSLEAKGSRSAGRRRSPSESGSRSCSARNSENRRRSERWVRPSTSRTAGRSRSRSRARPAPRRR
jgi:hypothetical protein